MISALFIDHHAKIKNHASHGRLLQKTRSLFLHTPPETSANPQENRPRQFLRSPPIRVPEIPGSWPEIRPGEPGFDLPCRNSSPQIILSISLLHACCFRSWRPNQGAYPFSSLSIISLCRQELALKVMVFVCFVGLKKERFVEGRAVLPKFFLEDVGRESFEVLRRGKMTVGVSDLPQVMVESFLRDYLEVDYVAGRELKAFCGYFCGLMEERRERAFQVVKMAPDVIGIGCFRKCLDREWFLNCKEIYVVSEQERRNWHQLPRDLYPKPLIFHDGRLAFRPTFWATLFMFMWLPIGFTLGIIRAIVALSSLPFEIKFPILHLTGAQIKVSNPELATTNNANGALYVCNHRTLLDPLMLSYGLGTPLTAVVYSLSRVSEIISPIKTARLTRNREQDAELMHKLLSEGNLAVCPEGTTCREPYLLRFSPLFTEISDRIFPAAIDYDVSMFYGTTARVGGGEWDDVETSKYKTANLVQSMIAEELGFTCTKLTRKDKYLILAGNEGIVGDGKKV
ncbi:UNVERIFIED_CONTAM: putative glycerol-3-phosphate acyltransferase 3 [Sesamum calycinum]|uniref:Glycerol-3-phosphate acyltransferase 3 n=1 Tax=Sesamum calycinum TaxID=2727403 RepID=A0AAW2NVD1_9LAMI